MIPNNIIISNKDNFEKVLNSMKSWWAWSVHILSDFDRTLTYSKIGGEERPSIISVLRRNWYLWEEYTKKAYELYDCYHPIEIDPNIPMNEKSLRWLNGGIIIWNY